MAPYPFDPKPLTRVCTIPHRRDSVVKLHDGIPAFHKPKEWPDLGLPGSVHKIGGGRGVKRYLEDLKAGGHRDDVWWAKKMLDAIQEDCWEFFKQSESWKNLAFVFEFTRTPVMSDMFVKDQDGLWKKFSLDLEAGRRKIGEMYPGFGDPENGCEPLGKQGARGALFRLTLDWYGYTFVAKGTVTAFEVRLKHEGLIYRHLDKAQGELIPVYLGNISLVRPYFLDVGVKIVHMPLMSWAGEQARKDLMLAIGRDLAVETSGAVTKLLGCGVEHRDLRPPNVLWNPEISNVVLVDFERSQILKQVQVLQETSPNRKRKHLHLDPEASCGLSF